MVSAITISSDDSDNSISAAISWPSPIWRRDAELWAERRSRRQVPPPTPAPSASSHADSDWLELADLDEPVGEWVTAEEANHGRHLATGYSEQTARIQVLEGQLYASQNNEAAAENMNAMLGERVAEISIKFCQLGISLNCSRMMIKALFCAVFVFQVVVVALLVK